MIRAKAIFFALKYGALPWWTYEAKCHHLGRGYWSHLGLNLRLAGRWATGRETEDDVRLELFYNAPLPLVSDLRLQGVLGR